MAVMSTAAFFFFYYYFEIVSSTIFNSKHCNVPYSKQRHSALWRRKSKSDVRQPSVHETATGSEHEQKEEESDSPEEERSSDEETDVRGCVL